MLHSRTDALSQWLIAVQPGRLPADWPPPIRAIEDLDETQPELEDFSDALDRALASGRDLATALSDPETVAQLQLLLAQFGAARLLHAVTAITDHLPIEVSAPLLRELRGLGTPAGRSIDAALDMIARITLRGRLVAEDRLDALRRAVELARKELS